jgi:hypothetical protein
VFLDDDSDFWFNDLDLSHLDNNGSVDGDGISGSSLDKSSVNLLDSSDDSLVVD